MPWSGSYPSTKHHGSAARKQQRSGAANATAHTDAASWPAANGSIKCPATTAGLCSAAAPSPETPGRQSQAITQQIGTVTKHSPGDGGEDKDKARQHKPGLPQQGYSSHQKHRAMLALKPAFLKMLSRIQ